MKETSFRNNKNPLKAALITAFFALLLPCLVHATNGALSDDTPTPAWTVVDGLLVVSHTGTIHNITSIPPPVNRRR